MNNPAFAHEALFYGSDEEFLAGTVPLLRAGLEEEAQTLVAVSRDRTELLRGELGDAAGEVEFVDMTAAGRNPGRIISIWRDFLDRAPAGGTVRGIGEPVWAGRSEAELDECRRHEALLNVAFDDGRPFTLLCPYDSSLLDDDVLAAACKSHPHVVRDGARLNGDWQPDLGATFLPFGGSLPAPPAGSRTLCFGRDRLGDVRKLIAREAGAAGLSAGKVRDLVVAVSEVAANSILHGGGSGELRAWREQDALVAEVRDAGRIEAPLAGRLRPNLVQANGRGLWMVNQLCDLVQVRSGARGTGVRLRMSLARAS